MRISYFSRTTSRADVTLLFWVELLAVLCVWVVQFSVMVGIFYLAIVLLSIYGRNFLPTHHLMFFKQTRVDSLRSPFYVKNSLYDWLVGGFGTFRTK